MLTPIVLELLESNMRLHFHPFNRHLPSWNDFAKNSMGLA